VPGCLVIKQRGGSTDIQAHPAALIAVGIEKIRRWWSTTARELQRGDAAIEESIAAYTRLPNEPKPKDFNLRERSQAGRTAEQRAFCRTKPTARDIYSVVKERASGLSLRVDVQTGACRKRGNKELNS